MTTPKWACSLAHSSWGVAALCVGVLAARLFLDRASTHWKIMQPLIYGIVGLLALALAICLVILIVMWLILPLTLNSRMLKIIQQLSEIESHSKSIQEYAKCTYQIQFKKHEEITSEPKDSKLG